MSDDWQGNVVPDNEDENKEVWAWKISPSLDNSYDCIIIRDYYVTIEYLEELSTLLLDRAEEDDLKQGKEIVIKIKLIKTTPLELSNLDE